MSVNLLTMIEETPTPGPWEAAVIAQIAAEREAQRMPVAELAAMAGIHPGSWSRYMKGERHLTLDMVERFAVALGLELNVLLARADDRQGHVARGHLEVVRNGLNGGEGEPPAS
jgi:transcriptional regulator with XRE-family HTH domain